MTAQTQTEQGGDLTAKQLEEKPVENVETLLEISGEKVKKLKVEKYSDEGFELTIVFTNGEVTSLNLEEFECLREIQFETLLEGAEGDTS